MVPRLKEKYHNQIIPAMTEQFGYKNRLQVPKLEKIIINMGVGEGAHNIDLIKGAMEELALITGQRPVMTRAKKSIANFKIKKGQPVGCKVTLREGRMYEFLDRLINVTLPRIRDFRGLPADSFDQNGNYSIGLKEQTIFPEIDYDKVNRTQGMDVTIVTTAKVTPEAYELLRLLGIPFSDRMSYGQKGIDREKQATSKV